MIMSKLIELVTYFGTQDKMAEALEVTQGAVSQWIATGGLPARRAIEVVFGKSFSANTLPGQSDHLALPLALSLACAILMMLAPVIV